MEIADLITLENSFISISSISRTRVFSIPGCVFAVLINISPIRPCWEPQKNPHLQILSKEWLEGETWISLRGFKPREGCEQIPFRLQFWDIANEAMIKHWNMEEKETGGNNATSWRENQATGDCWNCLSLTATTWVKKRFENQDMIIRSAKYTKLGAAASMRKDIQE